MDFREEMMEAYRRAYEAHPGLEAFRGRKKALLWGMMALFALSKLLTAIPAWNYASHAVIVIGGLMGLVIPGIFALAVWRGGWRFSLALLLPAASIALDLFRSWFPALAAGGDFHPLFHVTLWTAVATCLYLIGVVLYLSVPAKNRAYGEVLNQVTEALILRSKELAAQQRPGQPAPAAGYPAPGRVPAAPPAQAAPEPRAAVPPSAPSPQAAAPSFPQPVPAGAGPEGTEPLSCYRQIADAAGPEGLDDSFSLSCPGPEQGGIRFAAGARDGITMYHTHIETKDDPALHEILALISAGYLQSEERLNSYFDDAVKGPRMLSLIDGLQGWISGHREELDPGMLYRFAGHIIRESRRPECVKLGLSLLEMLHGTPEEEAELRRVISTLALCDEFTLFCLYVIRGWEDGAAQLFRLAKLVHGWGRIFLVHELPADSQEVRDWLLREGWRNTVLSNYSTRLCAQRGGLPELLAREELTTEEWTAARELTTALLEEQPLPGLSAMEEGPAMLEDLLRHAARTALTAEDRSALEQLLPYLTENGREGEAWEALARRCRGLLEPI